jgi:hypothetical protein
MKKILLFTILGIVLGITGSITIPILSKQKKATVKIDSRSLSQAANWLLTEDFTAKKLYAEQGVYEELRDADSISVSLAKKGGDISFGPYQFEKTEVSLRKEHIRMAKEVFLSPNSYRAVSACLFDPGALFRIKNKDKETYILVCLSCSDLAIGRSNPENTYPVIGLSKIGADSILHLLLSAFPNSVELQQRAISRGY